MNRIDKKFKELKSRKKKAFIAYITAGDPNLAVTAKLITALESSGVDIIELGIPFSDPLADGPVIQAASQRALRNKTCLKKIFKMVKTIRPRIAIPIVFMTYYNPVLQYGLADFMKACKADGVDGVIVPDLPYEEAVELVKLAKKYGVAAIFLIAPTSGRKRIKDIIKRSGGFIYYVSLTGVTGVRKDLSGEIKSKVKAIKSMTRLPVCVGFGISDAVQARTVARIADGVIVGSAIVKIIENNACDKNLVSKVLNFSKNLAKAIHGI